MRIGAMWRQVFSTSRRMDLRWFFAQWVGQAGAPVLKVHNARVKRLTRNPRVYPSISYRSNGNILPRHAADGSKCLMGSLS